jgi:glycosyltransferase involved in cell wall biosynthesis
MKKVAVLIPAFNAAQTIALAIDSMLWQEVPAGYEYEIHVVDDGSSDGTREALEQIAGQQRGSRLRIVNNERNLGVTPSRNRLIAGSDAEYFVVMDADDVSLPGRIAAQIGALEAGHDLVGTFAYNFGSMHGDRKYSRERMHHVILALIDQRSFCHPTIAFNRRVAQIGYKQNTA